MKTPRELIKGKVLRVFEEPGRFDTGRYSDPLSFSSWKLIILSEGRKLEGVKPKRIETIKPVDRVEFTAEVHTYNDGRQFYKSPRDMRITK